MPSRRRVSVTFTALIWTGILLALAGAVLTVMGASADAPIEAEVGGMKLKTAHVGLTLVVIGSALAGIVGLRLPEGVSVFSGGAAAGRSTTESVAYHGRLPLLAVAALALAALVYLLASG